MAMPLIPDNAPFSPAQRAWLNGFFAGLFGLNGANSGAVSAPALAATGANAAPAQPEEEFPWHDPTVPLPDRMQLAEGKPFERKLMAAMAQTDCHACGYDCRGYADASLNEATSESDGYR